MIAWGREQPAAAAITWHHGLVQDLPGTAVFDAAVRSHFALSGGEQVSCSTLLFVSAEQIRGQLTAAGFAEVTLYGDWDGSPMTDVSPEIIIRAR
jgi:hypothetical protein